MSHAGALALLVASVIGVVFMSRRRRTLCYLFVRRCLRRKSTRSEVELFVDDEEAPPSHKEEIEDHAIAIKKNS